jgi:hypothetical protein
VRSTISCNFLRRGMNTSYCAAASLLQNVCADIIIDGNQYNNMH